jgi:hypothetical protein
MIVCNHQPQFLPYLGFFHKLARSDLYVVLDDVQFLERGHQHRNLIKMQTGTQWLTVPVRQRRGQLIHEVEIDPSSNWRKKHWAALTSNYAPAPFWKELSPGLARVLVEGGHTHLAALDLDLLRWAADVLGIATPFRLASELGVPGEATQRHIDIARAVGADVYLSGQGGKLYMDLALFDGTGIEPRFQDYAPREYPQRFPQHGFVPNLSVVDALFNVGPEGTRALLDL